MISPMVSRSMIPVWSCSSSDDISWREMDFQGGRRCITWRHSHPRLRARHRSHTSETTIELKRDRPVCGFCMRLIFVKGFILSIGVEIARRTEPSTVINGIATVESVLREINDASSRKRECAWTPRRLFRQKAGQRGGPGARVSARTPCVSMQKGERESSDQQFVRFFISHTAALARASASLAVSQSSTANTALTSAAGKRYQIKWFAQLASRYPVRPSVMWCTVNKTNTKRK